MTEMPRYSRFREHFMAPGPHVEIMKDKPISFDEAGPSNRNTGDDDEDSTGYRYYHSDKIIGKLFDAIDEQEIFQRIQHNSSQHALHRIDRRWDRNRSLLSGIWTYIRDRCPSVKWGSHLDMARGIRDEKVFPSTLPFAFTSAYNTLLIQVIVTGFACHPIALEHAWSSYPVLVNKGSACLSISHGAGMEWKSPTITNPPGGSGKWDKEELPHITIFGTHWKPPYEIQVMRQAVISTPRPLFRVLLHQKASGDTPEMILP